MESLPLNNVDGMRAIVERSKRRPLKEYERATLYDALTLLADMASMLVALQNATTTLEMREAERRVVRDAREGD